MSLAAKPPYINSLLNKKLIGSSHGMCLSAAGDGKKPVQPLKSEAVNLAASRVAENHSASAIVHSLLNEKLI
jgi:hypothetical protein